MTRFLLNLLGLFLFTSCSWVNLEEKDCPEGFWIQLEYTYNLLYVNAVNQVKEAQVYVFDSTGVFLQKVEADSTSLAAHHHQVQIPDLKPGTYTFVVWSGLDADWVKGTGTVTLTDSPTRTGHGTCPLDPIFFGKKEQVEVTGDYQLETIDLMKDTNTISCLLESSEGLDLQAENYEMTLEVANGTMDFNNHVLPSDLIRYIPYSTSTVEVQDANSGTHTAARYAFSTLRLMEGDNARLKISNLQTGQQIYDIPLTEVLSLLSVHYNLPPQEYLDREDTFPIVFYLNKLGEIQPMLKVNSWVLVYNPATL